MEKDYGLSEGEDNDAIGEGDGRVAMMKTRMEDKLKKIQL